jgi:hypothetical protein
MEHQYSLEQNIGNDRNLMSRVEAEFATKFKLVLTFQCANMNKSLHISATIQRVAADAN